MDIRILKYFVTVAKEKNITKAADSLFTSQSNLSRQLADLEREIGRKLLVRGSRTVTLTEEGMFLYKRAQEIIELTEKTENDLRFFNENVSGTVHIGAIETYIMRHIAKALILLRKKNPNINYDLFSGSIAEITEKLNKGLLDFGIIVAPVDMKNYDYLKLPMKDTFGIILRKDHPLAGLDCISPEDLKDYPVWVSKQQLEGNVLSSWLGFDMAKLNIISTFNLITSPAMMVEEGMGMAFAFDKLVNTSISSPLSFRPLKPEIEGEIYLVWKKSQTFSSASKIFLEHLQKTLF